jgi:hypothetical protein
MSNYFESIVGDVRTWGWKEVQQWTKCCGFNNEIVLSNIERYKIDGKIMLTANIPAIELGVSDLVQYDLRMQELVLRYSFEKSLKYGHPFDGSFDCVNEDETGFDRLYK